MRKFFTQLLLSFILLISLNQSGSAQVVISQVYGGGGNSGATYTNDFIELFNRGTSAVSITGWSVQYASSAGTTWQKTDLSGTLQPGQYYLIQQAAGSGGTTPLPTPDATGTIAMSGTNGKVALVNTNSLLAGICPIIGVVDFVGFGSANCFEGAGATPVLTNLIAAIRNANGCTDTDNNSADFSTGAPTPRNSVSPLNPCSGPPVLSVSVTAGTDADESGTNGTFNLTLSGGNAPVGGITVTYSLTGSATINSDYTDPQAGSITIAQGNNSATITLNVINDLDIEGNETIDLTINSVTSPFIIGTSTATINIIDNDFPVNPNISLVNTYSQDFNTLASSGNSSDLPNGWLFSESGTNANTLYTAGTGSGTGGDTYSFGSASSSERAFGTLLSGSLTSTIGAQIQNNSGATITKLKIFYTGEQWRLGALSRLDKLSFQYSTDATSLTTGTWTAVTALDFITPVTTVVGAKNGNLPANQSNLVYTLRNLSIPTGAVFLIRWKEFNASGSDDGLAVDDFSIEANPVDLVPPALLTITPANNETNVPLTVSATATFNEEIQKGTGNIRIRRNSDQSIFQSINVSASTVTVAGTSLQITLNNLEINTTYYIEIDNGAIKDLDNNDYAGITGNGTWKFTTGINLYTANFQNCTSAISDGFTQYSQVGAIVWGCTPFGRDPAAPIGTTAFPSGVQINGFSGGTNVPNVDWLISPSFDLTATQYPLLSFWSRVAFNGQPLELKVSTNYTGGDPSLATWTDINGKFPSQASNVWTLSENINLSEYKQSNVRFAFVYHSSDDDGARWTLDDIALANSPVPPPPSVTVNTTDLQYGYAAAGGNIVKPFIVRGNDIIGDISVTASTGFSVSTNVGGPFTPSIVLSQASSNNINRTVYSRFTPNVNNTDFSGTITISTPSVLDVLISLHGTSIDPVTTLEVVNWNIEWFGSPANGPTNDALQQANVQSIFQNIGADIYGLTEIVNETRLADVVANMPGYSYVISNFSSHTNTSANPASALASAQKLAFIYKNDVFTNVSTTALLSQGINTPADLTNPAYNYWSSGRFPYMLTADVTLNCITKKVRFVLVHAKANTSPTATSYDRRKKGSDTLHQTLQTLYPTDHVIILGDFNDDLDQSITAGFTTTSWSAFTMDNANFFAPTLSLSLAGKKSTVSYNDVIDHVIVSNDIVPQYMPASANILTDVASLVTNFGSTTSDHYPVFTRYIFRNTIEPTVTTCTEAVSFCVTNNNTYTIPVFVATDDCLDPITYSYEIKNGGVTTRTGTTNDASGTFNSGTNTIYWTATDNWGNTATCQTIVTINPNPSVTIPDAYALPSGTLANTVYLGYAPASMISLTAVASGGTPEYLYNWSSGSTTSSTSVGPVVTTTYTVTIMDANSCQAVANKTVTVMDIRGGNKLDKVVICHKGNSQVVDGNSITAHLAHADMLGACPSASRLITALKIVEETTDRKLAAQVLPNPSTGYFTILIQSATTDEKINVRITDVNGRTIEQKQNLFADQTLKVGSTYQPGLYFVEISQGLEKATLKLIKL